MKSNNANNISNLGNNNNQFNLSQKNIYNDKINNNISNINKNGTINGQLMIDNESIFSTDKEKELDKTFNFKARDIPLLSNEKAGCGSNYINTFCIFKTSDGKTVLVYSTKNCIENIIRIYYLNLDAVKFEKIFIYDNFDEKDNSNAIKENRRIPTQCRHFKLEQEDYLIICFKDSYLYLYKYEKNIFNQIKDFSIGGKPIIGVCLFKNRVNNEINIITIQMESSLMKITDLDGNNKDIKMENNIYFLDIFQKNNKNYLIVGFLNEVGSFELEYYPQNMRYYKNKEKKNNSGKGHECIIIYKSKENEKNIKLIDSDTEGKVINIFNFESALLLLILDLKYCKPLGLDFFNKNYIIISCFEDERKDSIKIININLEKENYKRNYIDLERNNYSEEEAKIVCCLNGHEKGVLSCLKMENKLYGEFLVSIGMDNKLKLWVND